MGYYEAKLAREARYREVIYQHLRHVTPASRPWCPAPRPRTCSRWRCIVALPDFQTYGALVYSLQEQYPSIQGATLVLATIGPTLAKLEGQVTFAGDVILDVWELIDFEAGRIRSYSYEIYRAGEKIAWYDPFEHPHIS